MTEKPSFAFHRVGQRLVDSTNAFAIWEKHGPEYYISAVLGYIDARPLYEFALEFGRNEVGTTIHIEYGSRQHRFEEDLIGRLFPLIRDTLPAIIDLPACSKISGNVRLFAASDLLEHVAYSRRGPPVGEPVEIAHRDGD